MRCHRCGAALRGGYCTDETCPFDKHFRTCANGWYGHPENGHLKLYDCKCEESRPRLAKTIIKVEVLHDVGDSIDGLSLEQIHNECTDGSWSMASENGGTVLLNKEAADKACVAQGTDPEFFFPEDEE